jgi:hypothetical protein
MARSSKDTYKVFINKTKEGLIFIRPFMKTLSLGELMLLCKNYLYKSEDFQELFSNRIGKGNLSQEFVSYLLSLFANDSLR